MVGKRDQLPALGGPEGLLRDVPGAGPAHDEVLAPGGTFLTQQIHGLWAEDLIAAFEAKPQWPDSTPDKYIPRLQAAGLKIVELREWAGQLAFTDIGAIVYYLKAVPWLVPGFTVDSHLLYLLQMQERLRNEKQLIFKARKYLVEAQK